MDLGHFGIFLLTISLCHVDSCESLMLATMQMLSEWLLPIYEKQWQKMLTVYTCEDMGPADISLEVFEKHACRYGRTLASDTRVRIKIFGRIGNQFLPLYL